MQRVIWKHSREYAINNKQIGKRVCAKAQGSSLQSMAKKYQKTRQESIEGMQQLTKQEVCNLLQGGRQ